MMRRIVLFTALLTVVSAASAQSFPSKPIRLIVPYAAGQNADIKSRYFGDLLSKALGQPVVVDNRPGAGGNIGTAAAAKLPADGYTIVYGTAATFGMNPALYRTVGFDPDNDFLLFSLWGKVPLIIVAGPAFQGSSFDELVAMAKAKPNTINAGTPNTTSIVIHALLKQQGVPIFAVPYKSSTQAQAELLGGQLALSIDGIAAVRHLLDAGRVKPLAITTLKTSQLLPAVKSVAEHGLPGFEVVGWSGFFVAKSAPAQIVNRLHAEMGSIIARPEVRKTLLLDGVEAAGPMSLGELANFMREERVKWPQRIKASNIPLVQ